MDLSTLHKLENTHYAWYSIPMSFELAGKHLDIVFDDGETTTLDFAAAPGMEVTPGNGKVYPYKCAKTGENRCLVSFCEGSICTSFVIDTGEGLVTRIIADASAKPSLSIGVISPGGSGGRHTVTGDFDGNAFVWSFGADTGCVFTAEYSAGAVSVSLPLAGGGIPDINVSEFTAVRLAEGVYLQTAVLTYEGSIFSVALTTDFSNMLCTGCVFGVNGGKITHRIIGGYGCAAKISTDEMANIDLYQF